jgi:hypothetical protein
MEAQRFSVLGRVLSNTDVQWQQVLSRVYDSAERPRCLCVPGGIEMYVAHHRHYQVKRMPDTGSRHHPGCPSYEMPAQLSGLGPLLGEAVLETAGAGVSLQVDFPWSRSVGRAAVGGAGDPGAEVSVAKRLMSLRALMHFLFERAGFNRWSPLMEGKRNQGVLHKYLMEAAQDISVKGLALAERLYVPEPFSEATRTEVATRRREKLAVLQPHDGIQPLALVLGELKDAEAAAMGRRVWIRHMPDAPLLIDEKTWHRFERAFAALLQARDADTGHRVRLVLAALVKARREHTYEIDAASLMLASEQWIPLDGVHDLALVQELVAQHRRFVKPMRYDAGASIAFPNALLLDVGPSPVALHYTSAFMTPKERAARERALAAAGEGAWVWVGGEPMPELPPALPSPGTKSPAARQQVGVVDATFRVENRPPAGR